MLKGTKFYNIKEKKGYTVLAEWEEGGGGGGESMTMFEQLNPVGSCMLIYYLCVSWLVKRN